MNALTVGLNKK